jgi:Ca2+-binding EF-hand superfamily protein
MRALTAAAVLAAPVAAMAQLSAAREQTFRERDKNHDGVLTLEEYGGHPGNFHAMDANGDGVLSRDEFVNRYRGGNENAPPVSTGPLVEAPVLRDTFAKMDENRDNVITLSEWRAELAPASFARLDRNHDGAVTRDEFANPLPLNSAEARFGDRDLNGNGIIERNEWRGEALAFDVVDRNRDNRITVDEYINQPTGYGYGTGTMESRFAQLDRNHNGVINRGEWRGETLSFDAVDRNSDNRITLDEYVNQPTAQGTGTMEWRFARLDRNRDGVVNRNEWQGETLSFDAVDENGDNRITRDEYVNRPTDGYGYNTGAGMDRMEARFAQMDRNRDGVVSRGEWRDSTSFRTVDRNNDGVVTLREYLTAPVVYEQPYGSTQQGAFRDLDRDGSGYIERREWPYELAEFDRLDRNADGRLTSYEYQNAVYSSPVTSDEFRRLDENGDGFISRREWSGSAVTFDRYDRNGDGVISRSEFLSYRNSNY